MYVTLDRAQNPGYTTTMKLSDEDLRILAGALRFSISETYDDKSAHVKSGDWDREKVLLERITKTQRRRTNLRRQVV